MTITPLSDVEAEAERVVALAEATGATARLLGGVAVARHRHGLVPEALHRQPADIDLVVRRGEDRSLRRALEGAGYTPNQGFNSLRGDRRLLYYDQANERQLDVFVGTFAMSHVLDLSDRLQLDPATLAPADLLLTKLQVVEVNRKDLVDALGLFVAHEIGDERDGDVIGVDRLVEVTSRDWGWYTTFTDNLGKLVSFAADQLSTDEHAVVEGRITGVREVLAQAHKSVGWKARSRVGRRVKWYELPEEVTGRGHG